jgi:hypothetical protein
MINLPGGFVEPHRNFSLIQPARALHEIDQIIGNEETIDADQLGRIRGIVLTTLNAWHQMYGNWDCHEKIEIDPEMEVRVDS